MSEQQINILEVVIDAISDKVAKSAYCKLSAMLESDFTSSAVAIGFLKSPELNQYVRARVPDAEEIVGAVIGSELFTAKINEIMDQDGGIIDERIHALLGKHEYNMPHLSMDEIISDSDFNTAVDENIDQSSLSTSVTEIEERIDELEKNDGVLYENIKNLGMSDALFTSTLISVLKRPERRAQILLALAEIGNPAQQEEPPWKTERPNVTLTDPNDDTVIDAVFASESNEEIAGE